MRHEGFTPKPAPDARGSEVLGYGWNLTFQPMTEPQAQWMLEQHLHARAAEIQKAWPPFASQPGSVQRVLLEMAYQLGVAGLLMFTKMLHCLAIGDRSGAAREVRHSTLATQTPSRANDYAAGLLEMD